MCVKCMCHLNMFLTFKIETESKSNLTFHDFDKEFIVNEMQNFFNQHQIKKFCDPFRKTKITK